MIIKFFAALSLNDQGDFINTKRWCLNAQTLVFKCPKRWRLNAKHWRLNAKHWRFQFSIL